MWKLLVIDDEPERTEQIADWFKPLDYAVIQAHTGRQGLQQARDQQPDLILLDIMLKGQEMDGHEVLLRLKRDPGTAKIPVVIWSFRADEPDGITELLPAGLREGADYVVAKKWGLLPLEEVVRKLLAENEPGSVIRAGSHTLRLGDECIEVWVDGAHVSLTRQEARVLAYLDDHRGKPCRAEEIADEAWEDAFNVGDAGRARRIIERLRAKIEPNCKQPVFIVTVTGHGYKLAEGDQKNPA